MATYTNVGGKLEITETKTIKTLQTLADLEAQVTAETAQIVNLVRAIELTNRRITDLQALIATAKGLGVTAEIVEP